MTDAPTPTVTPVGLVKAAIQQLRPRQWAKNVFVLAAVVFSRSFLHLDAIAHALVGFAAFSLVSSAGYVLNDLLDREADRKHPKKRHRPIASGRLPVWAAVVTMLTSLVVGLSLAGWLGPMFLAVTLAYLATTLAYSFKLKHVVILDVMVLAACYVWRAIGGAVAIGVAVSPWLFLCTAFLSLFIGFNKRRGELMAVGAGGGTRKNLEQYSPTLLAELQAIVTGNAVLSYALYTILGTTPWMALTIPYVLYGIFRYVYLVEQERAGGAPDETLTSDVPILVTGALYAITAVLVLLFAPGGH